MGRFDLRCVLSLLCLITVACGLQCLALYNNGVIVDGVEYATGTSPDNTSCICRTNLIWDSTKQKCIVDCNSIPYATGNRPGDYECQCIDGTQWSLFHFRCYVDCRRIPNAVYSQTYHICVPNCNVIQYAYGPAYITNTGVRCHCQTSYKWDWVNSMCVDTATTTL